MSGREKFKLSAILFTRPQGVCPKVGMERNKKIMPRSRLASCKYGSILFIYFRKQKARLRHLQSGINLHILPKEVIYILIGLFVFISVI